METKSFYLKVFNLAHQLPDIQLHDIAGRFAVKDGRKGNIIYAKGGEPKIFLLVSGKVKVTEVNADGQELIKELILPGDLFGDVLLNYDSPAYEYASVVSEHVIYLAIGQDDLVQLMQRNYHFTLNYLSKIAEKFKSLENRYINMVTLDAKSRLLFCFREWAKKEGKVRGDVTVVKNSLTHHDLAGLISASRQTVTNILNELKDSGVLNYDRREIRFIQPI